MKLWNRAPKDWKLPQKFSSVRAINYIANNKRLYWTHCELQSGNKLNISHS